MQLLIMCIIYLEYISRYTQIKFLFQRFLLTCKTGNYLLFVKTLLQLQQILLILK